MAFKVGDPVRLKAGGPEMTVEKVNSNGIYCAWFDRDHNLHRKYFVAETLERGGDVVDDSIKKAKRKKA